MFVTVKTLTGESFLLEVGTQDSVEEVKEMISKVTSISPEQQRLLYAGQPLCDHGILSDYNIRSGSIMYLIRRIQCIGFRVMNSRQPDQSHRVKVGPHQNLTALVKFKEGNSQLLCQFMPKFQVFVNTQSLTGKTITLHVTGEDTVEHVKTLICGRQGIPPDQQRILYASKPLRDGRRLKEYSIRHGITLHLHLRLLGGMLMYFKTQLGTTIAIDIHASDTIHSVKCKIQEKRGIPPRHQNIILAGKILKDWRTVGDYNIQRESMVFLSLSLGDHLELLVKIMFSKSITLAVGINNTVESVKHQLGEREGIPPEKQQLIFAGKQLEDVRTLWEYNIQNHDIVHLDYPMEIVVCVTLTGQRLTLDVMASDTVRKLKMKIQERINIPPPQQRLLFAGQPLDSWKTLSDYNFQKEDNLNLVVCIKTGLQIFVKTLRCETIALDVAPINTIEDVKDIMVHNNQGIQTESLIFAGKLLKNWKKLQDYGIQNATTLFHGLFVILQIAGRRIEMMVRFEESIRALKFKVSKLEDVPADTVKLVCDGEELEDGKILMVRECTGVNRDCILMDVNFKKSMHIYVVIRNPAARLHKKKIAEIPGKKICLKVLKEMDVFRIKTMIQHKECIPVYLQKLFLGEYELKNHTCLMTIDEAENSILHLIIEAPSNAKHMDRFKLRVRGPNEDLWLSDISAETTITEVRKAIPFAGPQRLLYHGSVPLNEEKTIQDYLITDESTIYVVYLWEIPLLIRRPGSQLSEVVGAHYRNTIADIKAEVSGITSNHCFFFENKPLPDSKTLDECSIPPASEILLVDIRETPVYIKTRFTEDFICIQFTDSVHSLKERISKALYLPIERQRLIYNAKVLSSTSDLSSGSILYLVVIPNELDIHITLPSKRTLSLICSLEETVGDIKMKIEQNEGIPVEHQVLPFDNNTVTIREASIQPGNQLQLHFGEINYCSFVCILLYILNSTRSLFRS